jgi:adenylate kinase
VTEDDLVKRLAARGRSDDDASTVRNRLKVFERTTAPLVDYYEERGLLFSVPATGSIDAVTSLILTGPSDVARRVRPAPDAALIGE